MSNSSNQNAKARELEKLRTRVAELERELETSPAEPVSRGYYLSYYATTGFFLGMIGAITSLLFNVVGSQLFGKDALEIIKVYLTFGMGERAFEVQQGLTLAVGCCLYIGTGMLLGVPFQVVLSKYAENSSLFVRLVVASMLGIAIWLFNFYAILSWLQPLLFEGNWITNPHFLPPWVAALTHLVFAWTMAVVYPWGLYTPYRLQTEQS
jgi:hypothetical protein